VAGKLTHQGRVLTLTVHILKGPESQAGKAKGEQKGGAMCESI